jgi:hypothetical protein
MANAQRPCILLKREALAVSVFAILMLTAGSSLAAAEGANLASRELPRELYEFGVSQGCTPPADFYSARPGLEQPPYVYAHTREPKPAAALWCHEQGQPEGHYTLLFRRGRGSVGQGGCAPLIRSQTYIGGLSLITGYKSPLSSFSRVGDPSHNGPADARVSGPVIRSEYDGVAREYYCYRGIWFERAFD